MVIIIIIMMVYDILNMAKLMDMTRDIDRAIMMKFYFILCSFEQLDEQGMIDVHYWYDESLLLLSLTHHHRDATFWDVSQFLNIILMMMKTRQMKFQIMRMVFVSDPHFVWNYIRSAPSKRNWVCGFYLFIRDVEFEMTELGI